jgi:peptidoglycan/LPS O-acetylase OafA/YrhL
MEWQDHRYDPGHFTGGNIDPVLKARRPNKYGYVLLAGGVIMILVVLLGPTDHILSWYYVMLEMGLAVLLIAAGLRLLKKPRSQRSKVTKYRQK